MERDQIYYLLELRRAAEVYRSKTIVRCLVMGIGKRKYWPQDGHELCRDIYLTVIPRISYAFLNLWNRKRKS